MENLAWVWIGFGILLIILEIFVPSFIAIFFGVAAIIVGALTLIAPLLPLAAQGLVFAIISIITIVVFFKCIKPKLKSKSTTGFSNQIGVIIHTDLNAKTGLMRFPFPVNNKEEWEVISENELVLNKMYRALRFDPQSQKLVVEMT